MAWIENFRRTPTWPWIVAQFFLGLVMLTLAVLYATRYAEQVATHGDGLFTVGFAAVGGLAIGSGNGMIRHRAAMRHVLGMTRDTAAWAPHGPRLLETTFVQVEPLDHP